MKNTVIVSVEFSFKGQHLQPTLTIDLDPSLQQNGSLPDFYLQLANNNDIGLYSYEYEMLQAESLHFEAVEGFVADYIHDGALDIGAFVARWETEQLVEKLQQVAERHMGVSDLDANEPLKAALIAAYRLGESATPLETRDEHGWV